MKVVMALSGGMDSTTLLGALIDDLTVEEVHCCVFTYGSKHNKYENAAAVDVINYYKRITALPIIPHYISLVEVMQGFKSALFKSSEREIPEGHYNEESMRATVVPGRNLIFASIMAGLAESIGADAIALGVHQGDHHIYPDCRTDFIKSLDTTVRMATDGKVRVLCPLLFKDKTTIIQMASNLSLIVPYHLTRTCYKDQPISCGKCGSCTERLEAFANNQLEDPILYEEE